MIIAVTRDKYEHTIYVADSVVEMAKKLHINVNTIYRDIRGERNVVNKSTIPYRFYKVEDYGPDNY